MIKDKTPKNTTWLVLDHHPLYRTGRVSRGISKMFQRPLEALLDHACGDTCGDTEHLVIRISSRKAMPHDKVPEIHSHFVICCDNFDWGLCFFFSKERSLSCEIRQMVVCCFFRSGPFLVR